MGSELREQRSGSCGRLVPDHGDQGPSARPRRSRRRAGLIVIGTPPPASGPLRSSKLPGDGRVFRDASGQQRPGAGSCPRARGPAHRTTGALSGRSSPPPPLARPARPRGAPPEPKGPYRERWTFGDRRAADPRTRSEHHRRRPAAPNALDRSEPRSSPRRPAECRPVGRSWRQGAMTCGTTLGSLRLSSVRGIPVTSD